jgi:3-hydroxyisobutyrate dehydrogenase-like beta-hydroxyacid dehydrogenase
MNVGFIGLGNIGKPMARRLLKLDGTVTLYDVNPAPLKELAAAGAKVAESPAQVARASELIGVCVRDDADVEGLLRGSGGVLRNAAKGSVIAIHSTVTQQALLGWAQEAAIHGLHLIDAPITGGAAGAEAGTLAYMVGGEAEVLERCRPVFATSGSKIIHAGPVGSGIALKLCNNVMTYAAFSAMREAYGLARAGGLDPALLIEVGKANGVVTPQMEAFIVGREKLFAMNQHAYFKPFAALGKKDLEAALASARALDLRLPMTEHLAGLVEDVFMKAISKA